MHVFLMPVIVSEEDAQRKRPAKSSNSVRTWRLIVPRQHFTKI